MRTAIVKCHLPYCSEHAKCIVDDKGREAFIPDRFVLRMKYDEVSKRVCEVTIPLWLAIDSKLNYQEW
jgi:hypothetical protein